MSLIPVLILGLQAAAVATPAASAPPPAAQSSPGALRWAMIDPGAQRAAGNGDPLDFDLARYRSTGSCGGVAGAEVLVCGPRHGRGDYPLEYWDRIFGPEPPLRTQMSLGGGATGDVHVESQDYSNGTHANRVMVGIKLPF